MYVNLCHSIIQNFTAEDMIYPRGVQTIVSTVCEYITYTLRIKNILSNYQQ